MIYFTSDLHLGHTRIIELCNRGFASLEEMHRTIITNYNSVVTSDDVVYFLGDVCMGKLDHTLPLLNALRGEKRLILGNHDRPSKCYPHRKGEEARIEWDHVYSLYFSEVKESALLQINGTEVLLSHFPYADPSYTDQVHENKYLPFQPVDEGKFLIHGHIHNQWKTLGRQINVGVDVWNFFPVSMEVLSNIIAAGENSATRSKRGYHE